MKRTHTSEHDPPIVNYSCKTGSATRGKAKFTPGPWRDTNLPLGYVRKIVADGPRLIATLPPEGGEEQEANARLIAAAPCLLEACIQARAALPDAWAAVKCNVPEEVIELLDRAIAAAGGPEK